MPRESKTAFASTSLRDAITHRPIKSEVTFEKQRNELYEKLVQPVLPYIKGAKDALIVPDGNLSFLPFDMLRENGERGDSEKDIKRRFALKIFNSAFCLPDRIRRSQKGRRHGRVFACLYGCRL